MPLRNPEFRGKGTGAHKRQQGAETRMRIMEFLISYVADKGYPPTQVEISAALDLDVRTVRDRLHDLDKEGLITKGPGARAITVNVT